MLRRSGLWRWGGRGGKQVDGSQTEDWRRHLLGRLWIGRRGQIELLIERLFFALLARVVPARRLRLDTAVAIA